MRVAFSDEYSDPSLDQPVLVDCLSLVKHRPGQKNEMTKVRLEQAASESYEGRQCRLGNFTAI